MDYKIRKAVIEDSQNIQRIIKLYAEEGRMLHRPLQHIYEHIRDFFVAVAEDGKLIGACAFSVSVKDMAEVKSLAVDKEFQRYGIASALIKEGLQDITTLGINKVFCLTYVSDFFSKMGFTTIDKNDLPHKIWTECINCPSFPDCKETAMIRDV